MTTHVDFAADLSHDRTTTAIVERDTGRVVARYGYAPRLLPAKAVTPEQLAQCGDIALMPFGMALLGGTETEMAVRALYIAELERRCPTPPELVSLVLCLGSQISLPADVCEQYNKLIAMPAVARAVEEWGRNASNETNAP